MKTDKSVVFSSATIREQAVSAAWKQAVSDQPALALLGNSASSLRRRMGEAVDYALHDGIIDFARLRDAALAAVPKPTRGNRPRGLLPVKAFESNRI